MGKKNRQRTVGNERTSPFLKIMIIDGLTLIIPGVPGIKKNSRMIMRNFKIEEKDQRLEKEMEKTGVMVLDQITESQAIAFCEGLTKRIETQKKAQFVQQKKPAQKDNLQK